MIKQMGRTGTLLVWLSLCGLAALVLVLGKPGGEAMLNGVLFFLGTLAGAQATKSTLEAASTGTGLKRAVGTMLGESTPPPQPPVPPAP